MKLLRNHGLVSRDKNLIFGYNSRLDTIQAVVAINALNKLENITFSRIKNLNSWTNFFGAQKNFYTYKKKNIEKFFLYHVRFENSKIRNKILKKLINYGIDAKIHYPTCMHLQPAAKKYGYKKGDFPVAEKLSQTSISLPVHEFVTKKDLKFMANIILEGLEN